MKPSDVMNLQADCGVVLTGSPGRVREAFEILAQKKIKKLIVSGVFKEALMNEIFPHLSFYPEISDQDIYLEKKSATTYGNAIQSLALVEALKCRDIVLITSQIHMYRANRIFNHIFPTTIKITKLAVPNRKDFSFFDYLLETSKVTLYWALGLVY
ncbi:MAG: YdcF family protein [Bdellovibrio sp.]|nr:YdcF family protein [Bdellovibrio sp.]